MNNTVYIVAGPTAVGKSMIAKHLAKRLNGEIINCDSVQLYKYMDIGSAKPTPDEMKEIKHHLFSIVPPDYYMTVATYQKLAFTVIDDVLKRGKTPIVCGGTGLYINSLLYDMDFGGSKNNSERRRELEEMAEKNGAQYMYQYLAAVDPASAERIHPNNTRKVIRAIEAYELGDGIKPLNECPLNPKYDFKLNILNMDREWLYERINQRVIKLIKSGLMQEFQGLLDMGYDISTPAMKGIGYKELFAVHSGEVTLADGAKEIMKNTRHYAKKQVTWFKRYPNARWIDIKPGDSAEVLVDRIVQQ